VGKIADIIIINGDPIEDIKNTRNVKMIIKEGEFYDPMMLLNSAKESIGPKDSEDHAEWELKIRPLRAE